MVPSLHVRPLLTMGQHIPALIQICMGGLRISHPQGLVPVVASLWMMVDSLKSGETRRDHRIH